MAKELLSLNYHAEQKLLEQFQIEKTMEMIQNNQPKRLDKRFV